MYYSLLAMLRVLWSACLSVCLSVSLSLCEFGTPVSPVKMAEPIQRPFGKDRRVCRRICALDQSAHWRQLANTSDNIRARRRCGLI